ncbi:MAG: hypothetical protein U1E21_18395 [Reyranellaceae bacterium]
MIDREEIWKRDINPEAAKEVLAQAEKRLADLLDSKKSFEARGASLLTAFMTLALALIGAAGAFLTNGVLRAEYGPYLPTVLFLSSIPLVFSAWCMIQVMQPGEYGNLGTEPSMWLRDKFIDAKTSLVSRMQATIAWDTQERLDKAFASNRRKSRYILIGSSAALVSPALLIIASVPFLANVAWAMNGSSAQWIAI